MVRKGVPRKIKALTNQYIRFLYVRKMTDAEKVLEKIKHELKPSSWNRGYYNALEGMIAAFKAKDNPYYYISRLDPQDKKRVAALRKEFSAQSTNVLQDEFEKGFFSAWLEYIKELQSMKKRMRPLNEFLSDKSP